MRDPYLSWAQRMHHRPGARDPDAGLVPVLVEPHAGTPVTALRRLGLVVPGFYDDDIRAPAFVAGWCRFERAAAITSAVRRLKYSGPGGGAAAAAGTVGTVGTVGKPWRSTLAPGRRPIVAVIDDGFAFAHAHFRRAGTPGTGTRVRWLWDQGRVLPPANAAGWREPPEFGYGRELDRTRLDALIERHRHNGVVDESACYCEADYAGLRDWVTHGTLVTDIAAGGRRPCAGSNAGGMAPEADLIFVQLPRATVLQTSGSSLPVCLVHALHYVKRRSQGAPVVVNLSWGAFAGPHDGSSMLERAIDDFLEQHDRFAIVVSAGNAFDACGHVQRRVPPHAAADLGWSVLPDSPRESFLEVWYGGGPAPHARGRRRSGSNAALAPGKELAGSTVASDLTVAVKPPGAARFLPAVRLDESAEITDAQGWRVGMVIHSGQVPNGNGCMAMIGLGPTRAGDARSPPAPHGTWQVRIVNTGRSACVFDAWIERAEPAFSDRRPDRQSRFAAGQAGLTGTDTLASLAGGTRTIVVGGYNSSNGAIVHDSSAGPTRGRRTGPDLLAVSEADPAGTGVLVTGRSSGVTVRARGTSVAAPQVTGTIAAALAENPRLSMARDSLMKLLARRLTASVPHGRLDPRAGIGRLAPKD